MGGTPRCPDCGADMQRCGEIVFDGPSFDCPQCQQIAMLRAENAALKDSFAAEYVVGLTIANETLRANNITLKLRADGLAREAKAARESMLAHEAVLYAKLSRDEPRIRDACGERSDADDRYAAARIATDAAGCLKGTNG